MAMTRRTFLAGCSSLLFPALYPQLSAAAPREGVVIFGYGQTGIGSKLISDSSVLLESQYRERRYRLYNEPGDNSLKAVLSAKQSPPDGSILLMAQSPQMTIFPSIYKRLPYNPLADFKPLAIAGEYTLLLTLGPAVDARVKSLDDYVRWVERNPEYSNIGFTQFGSPGYMAQLMLKREKGIALQPQSYAGTSMVVDDLLKGHLAAAFLISGNAIERYKSGQLRAIAVTNRLRHPGFDDVPTCREQGIPSMNINGWYGWFVPATMPDSVYRPLADAMQRTIVSYDYLEMLKKYYLRSVYDNPDKIRQRIQQEQAYYADMIESYRVSKV
ncbi:Bug family tripartite tricarboxylate transporter substrate binding protein [Dickeya undicola]|uniref:Tripartite tricarboxylate transporter substrate binding protein n=1 Tax=Dickeya undicola TaxID=1577887 RepID=A0A3N0FV44_9GAMM|nr:tripartite tricarboxylate transporter substrate binding protein [Dickeya undicola]RNM04053.1 tripartite tricarboxylate transporter substrate binding protein [Dickeya undicola]RNM20709.1 tripartite tricarboxylate transporter substrate binding protein [Dickeya undicola]